MQWKAANLLTDSQMGQESTVAQAQVFRPRIDRFDMRRGITFVSNGASEILRIPVVFEGAA